MAERPSWRGGLASLYHNFSISEELYFYAEALTRFWKTAGVLPVVSRRQHLSLSMWQAGGVMRAEFRAAAFRPSAQEHPKPFRRELRRARLSRKQQRRREHSAAPAGGE